MNRLTPVQDRRQRMIRYALIMGVALLLAVFGFFVPAPLVLRVIALVIAASLPPIAAITGNAEGSGRSRMRSR